MGGGGLPSGRPAGLQQMVGADLVYVAGGDPRWWPLQTMGGEPLQIPAVISGQAAGTGEPLQS